MRIEEFASMARAFQDSRILLTAIELNLFTVIEGGATASEAANRMGCTARGTERLLNALTALGLVEKHEGIYRNGEFASLKLTDSSPDNERPSMLHDVARWETWSKLTDCVRGVAEAEEHRSLSTERHRALLAMRDRKAVERAPKLVQVIGVGGVRRILDIGGGSAAYSIAFVRAGEDIEAEVFELPEIVPVTQEYITQAGEELRVRVRSGNLLFDEFAAGDTAHGTVGGYDLILLFSVSHIVGEAENRDLSKRCHRALRPGGRLAIHDHVLVADKTQPRAGAIFALNMLVATPTGGTYSLDEYRAWLHEAGFSAVDLRPLEGAPTSVLIATKAR